MPTFWLVFAGCLLTLPLVCYCSIRILLLTVTVEGQSMSPTLEHGDRVLALRHWPTRWVRKGSVVLVWPWELPPPGPKPLGGPLFIKRVIGLSGDTLTTPAIRSDASRCHGHIAPDTENRQNWHVPLGHCFVRGDNRMDAQDSLSWGPVPLKGVLAVVLMRFPHEVEGRLALIPDKESPLREENLHVEEVEKSACASVQPGTIGHEGSDDLDGCGGEEGQSTEYRTARGELDSLPVLDNGGPTRKNAFRAERP